MFHLDFETSSECDLKKCGLHVYAAHPSTIVTRIGFKFDELEGTPTVIRPLKDGISQLEPLTSYILEGGEGVAHNAAFELAIWNLVLRRAYPDIPPLPVSKMHCTQAKALAMGLPGRLEKVAIYLGTQAKKDMIGRRLMLKMSKPPKKKPFTEGEEETLSKYNATDVETEMEVDSFLIPLSDMEREVWMLDQKLNNRGVRIDVRAARKALEVVEIEKDRLAAAMGQLTKGLVSKPTQTAKLLAWIQISDHTITSLKKESLTSNLKRDDLHPHVRHALELRRDYAKTSTAKIGRMLKCVGKGDRVRGLTQYHGAGTGRFAGRLIQMQNLFKSKLKTEQLDKLFELLSGGYSAVQVHAAMSEFGDVMTALASCTRGMFIADEGETLYCADWSNIEGRILAVLAGETWKIDAFSDFDLGIGPDLYIKSYANTFLIDINDVTPEQRQIGKTLELACGYQGGLGAWRKMSSANPKVPFLPDTKVKEIVSLWRSAHKKTIKLWNSLHKASIRAVENPGKAYSGTNSGVPVVFSYQEGYLIAQLPSGRNIFYPKARLTNNDFGELEVCYESPKEGGETIFLYPGILTENIVQAIARDFLTEALLRADKRGIHLLSHVHDEIVASSRKGQYRLKDLEDEMLVLPEWAKGWPMAVKGWEGPRFKKDD